MADFFEKQHIEGLPFAAVLHHIKGVDDGDPHDHPFSFVSHVLHGWYNEIIYNLEPDGTCHSRSIKRRHQGFTHTVEAGTVHKIIDVSPGGCYTLILPSEKLKEPCFYRFVDGKVFVRQWNEDVFKPLVL